MSDRHATDEQIQAYLDGLVGPDYVALSEHIENCELCRETALQYRTLYSDLADETDIRLPADFARTVASKVAPTDTDVAKDRWSLSLVAAVLGPLLIGVVTLYLLGAESLFAKAGGLGHSMAGQAGELADGATAFFKQFGLRPDLALFPLLALLVVSVAERLLRRLRHGKAMLMA